MKLYILAQFIKGPPTEKIKQRYNKMRQQKTVI